MENVFRQQLRASTPAAVDGAGLHLNASSRTIGKVKFTLLMRIFITRHVYIIISCSNEIIHTVAV